jgi:hypothetical protein
MYVNYAEALRFGMCTCFSHPHSYAHSAFACIFCICRHIPHFNAHFALHIDTTVYTYTYACLHYLCVHVLHPCNCVTANQQQQKKDNAFPDFFTCRGTLSISRYACITNNQRHFLLPYVIRYLCNEIRDKPKHSLKYSAHVGSSPHGQVSSFKLRGCTRLVAGAYMASTGP